MGFDSLAGARENRQQIKSSVHIARLLCGEGYTEEIVARVERWQRNQATTIARRQRDFEMAKSQAGRILAKLTERERKVVGRFIAMKDRMAFEGGLKVGLTTAFYGDDGE